MFVEESRRSACKRKIGEDYNNSMSNLVEFIRENYQHTLDQIADAARKTDRDPNGIRLVVVTKSQPVEIAQAAIEAGVRILAKIIPKRVS